MTETVKILGISASHRKRWNTDYALGQALHAAGQLGPWVRTESIRLADYQINPCSGCHLCFMEGRDGRWCPPWRDGMAEIYPKLIEADAILVATPVYWQSSSAKLRDFIDRTNPFCTGANTPFSGGLSGKVGGVIAVAFDTHGGTELAVSHVQAWMLAIDMVVVGTGLHHPKGAYVGGMASTQLGTPSAGPDSIKFDRYGMRSIYGIGRRVAETALFQVLGRQAAEERFAADTAGDAGSGPYPKPADEDEALHIDWDRYYEHGIHFPREHVAVPGILGTSGTAFAKFVEVMTQRTNQRTGTTYGRGLRDPEAFRQAWLEGKKLRLLSDQELYALCPDYYRPYVHGGDPVGADGRAGATGSPSTESEAAEEPGTEETTDARD